VCDGASGAVKLPDDLSNRRCNQSDPNNQLEGVVDQVQRPSLGADDVQDVPQRLSDYFDTLEVATLPFDQSLDVFDKSLPWSNDTNNFTLGLNSFPNSNTFASTGFDFSLLSTSSTPSPAFIADLTNNMGPPPVPVTTHSRSALLEHWRSYICPIMIPTAAPSKNPYLQIYLPMALSEPQTEAKKCLLLAMQSVAGHSKAELSPKDKMQLKLHATELKEEAGLLLRQLVTNPDLQTLDNIDKESLVTAALTMTTVEVFSGEDKGTAYESLLLAKQIIQQTGGIQWWLQTASRSTLLQIFRCHEILAHTSGWRRFGKLLTMSGTSNVSATSQSPDEETSGTPLTMDENYTLDISFGVSKFSLKCLNQILEMATIKNAMTEGETWTQSQSLKLSVLEKEVFGALKEHDLLTFPDQSELPYQEGISSYISEELTQNHVLAFHNAVAIFFKRALCDGGTTVTPPVVTSEGAWSITDLTTCSESRQINGQTLVSDVFSHLENIDAIAGDSTIANTLWPAFVAAAEAIDTPLRHRALIWFARARRHGIGNIAKAKQLTMEVWRRLDRLGHWQQGLGRKPAGVAKPTSDAVTGELGSVDWRKVMEELGMYIMLT
jgi:hypothetical protein